MRRRVDPGSWGTDGRDSSEGRSEGAAGQQQEGEHQGWQTRTSLSSSRQPAGVPGRRSPLREAPAGNRKGNGGSQNLRPHDVPYTGDADRTAGGQEDKRIMTLRCMYTHQKAKKRKTWSDGAVKCCPKGQRVSLFRWSDALGVTDKLLGEIYLTASQYEAFVTQGEPELEMETFLVSLDGVVQPDNGSYPAGTASSAAAGGAESAEAGGTSGGGAAITTGTAGKKRKLFKAFKPPARRAPPPAPLPDDSWGPSPPARMMDQVRNGKPNGDGRGMMLPRTGYNGFGHVESLWDDDDDHDDSGNGGGREGMGRWGDRAGRGDSASVGISNAGWGMGAGGGFSGPRDGGGGAGAIPVRVRSSSSMSAAAAADAAGLNTSNWMWGNEDGRHAGGYNAGSGLPRSSAGDTAGQCSAQLQDMECSEDVSADRGQGQDDPSSYLDSLRRGDAGAEAWAGPTDRSSRTGGTRDVDEARDQGHRCTTHPPHDHGGAVAAAPVAAAPEGNPIEPNAASSQYGGGTRTAPDPTREPASRDSSNGSGRVGDAVAHHGGALDRASEANRDGSGGKAGAGAGAVEMRSTQDILSLFGGLEDDEDSGADDRHGYDPPGPRGSETAAATPLQQSHGPHDAPAPPVAAQLLPVGGGMPRAADMRRAQKESLAAAVAAAAAAAAASAVPPPVEGATVAGAGKAARIGSANSGTEQPAARSVAAGGVALPPEGWGCGVCGVRGGASAKSCRVCGAPRQQGPANEVEPERGGGVDERHGVVDGFSGSGHRQGWSGVDFGGGEDWQQEQQERDGVAGDGNAGDSGGGHDDLGDGDHAKGIVSREEEDVVGRRHRGSPVTYSSGSVRRASGEHRAAAGRMQIDVGSSSESDSF